MGTRARVHGKGSAMRHKKLSEEVRLRLRELEDKVGIDQMAEWFVDNVYNAREHKPANPRNAAKKMLSRAQKPDETFSWWSMTALGRLARELVREEPQQQRFAVAPGEKELQEVEELREALLAKDEALRAKDEEIQRLRRQNKVIDFPRTHLSIDWDTPPEEAKRAFKKAALALHPDRGGDPATFRDLNDRWSKLRPWYER